MHKATRIYGNDDDIGSGNSTPTGWELTVTLSEANWDNSTQTYRAIKVDYTYTVTENKSNWTKLQFSNSKTIYTDFNLVKLNGPTVETRNGTVSGEQHDYVRVISNNTTGLIKWLDVKIDGSGGDLNNIGIDLDINVNYTKKI